MLDPLNLGTLGAVRFDSGTLEPWALPAWKLLPWNLGCCQVETSLGDKISRKERKQKTSRKSSRRARKTARPKALLRWLCLLSRGVRHWERR